VLTKTLDEFIPDNQGITAMLNGQKNEFRDKLIRRFILNGLEKEETIVIVSLTKSAEDIVDELTMEGQEDGMLVNTAIMNEQFFIIDMFSFRMDLQPEEIIPGSIILESVEDLTSLSITIEEISRNSGNTARIIIWPFSLLVLYNGINSSLSFSQTLSARTRKRKQTCLFVTDEGVLTNREMSILQSVMDTYVETKMDVEEKTNLLRVPFAKGANPIIEWTSFTNLK